MRTARENLSLVIAVLFLSAVYISAGLIYDVSSQSDFIRNQRSTYVAQAMTAYEIDDATTTDVTYIRYKSGSGVVYIKRINESGTSTIIEYTNDNWANRVTATYIPINE